MYLLWQFENFHKTDFEKNKEENKMSMQDKLKRNIGKRVRVGKLWVYDVQALVLDVNFESVLLEVENNVIVRLDSIIELEELG